MKVGKITQQDFIKFNKIASREMSLENSHGWNSVNRVFKSKKAYSRKQKHKNGF